MSSVHRVYLPLGAGQLRVLHDDRRLAEDPVTGFAVTPRLRDALPPGGDEEEREYEALQQAASAAAANGQRIVVAADIDDAQVQPAAGPAHPATVLVREGVDLRRVVSVQVLDPAAEREAQSALDLSWYDVSELGDLLDLRP